MAKLIPRTAQDGTLLGYSFYCPACKSLHPFNVAGGPPLWWFNGDLESPSFSPSLRMLDSGCHLYVTGGQISYCNDCPHEFRNKIVPLVDWDFERWCPVSTLHTINGKPVGGVQPEAGPPPMVGASQAPAAQPAPSKKKSDSKKSQTHRAECGDVGDVGEVGDLGSNAK